MWVKLPAAAKKTQMNTWPLFQSLRGLARDHILPYNVWESCIMWKKEKKQQIYETHLHDTLLPQTPGSISTPVQWPACK